MIATAAEATTIDFNGLSNGSPVTAYTEFGFTAAPLSGSWLASSYGNPGPSIVFRSPASSTVSAGIEVTDAGAPFTFSAVDLCSSITTIPYTFTGLLDGNMVFTTTGTVPNTFGNFATVSDPDTTDAIDALQVRLTDTTSSCCSNLMGLDNIVVDAVVPEPSSLALLGISLAAGLGIIHRRAPSPKLG